MAKTSNTSEQFILRLPDGMRDRIKKEADKNGRSMNAEFVARLELSFNKKPEKFFGANALSIADRLEPAPAELSSTWPGRAELLEILEKLEELKKGQTALKKAIIGEAAIKWRGEK